MKLRITAGAARFEVELIDIPTSQAVLAAAPTDERPKLARPCNVLGKIAGDAAFLGKVRPGDAVKVERG